MCTTKDKKVDSSGRGLRSATTMRSLSHFFGAVMMGIINHLLAAIFCVPFVGGWLAWKYPYVVLPPALAYYLMCFDGSERKDGKPWAGFSRNFFIFRLARDYFDFQVHIDPALDASKMSNDDKFIFGLHPHGVTSSYRILLDGVTRENFPKLRSWRALGASVLFDFPIMRELGLWSHCIDAGRETAQRALHNGHSLFIVPGGEHEQILGQCGKEILYLKSRMGFVKLALKNNIPLVPAYVFGSSDEFFTSTIFQKRRLAIVRKLRIALPVVWGRFGLLIPRKVQLRVVFGAPMSFGDDCKSAADGGREEGEGRLRDVSDTELKYAHAKYVAALQKLFDDNKARFGYADRELLIL